MNTASSYTAYAVYVFTYMSEDLYAKDQKKFFADFSSAFQRLEVSAQFIVHYVMHN